MDAHLIDEWLVVRAEPGLLPERGDTDKGEQGGGVLEAIDDGRARDSPLDGHVLGECADLPGLDPLVIANDMGFVENDAIPGEHEHGLAVQDGIVVGDIHRRIPMALAVERHPVTVLIGFHEDLEPGLGRVLSPVIDKGEGTQDEREGFGVMRHGGEGLDSFAETHVVALEATVGNAFVVVSQCGKGVPVRSSCSILRMPFSW